MSRLFGELRKGKESKTFRVLFTVFIVLSITACLFSYQYYKSLHQTIRDESKNYLQEVARRVSSNIDQIIQDNFAILDAMSVPLESMDIGSFDEARRLLQEQQDSWNYDNILLVDDTGKAYDIDDSKSVFFAFDESMRARMLNREQDMTTTQLVNNKEYFIFAVPLENVELDGRKMISLAACYDPAALDRVLSMNSFSDKAYSQIINKSGTLVTKTSSPHSIKSGYNMFSTLEQAQMDNGGNLQKVLDDVEHDKENQISFSLDGVHRYMVYTPIQTKDWYLLTFVPFQVVNEKSDTLLRVTMLISGMIVFVFCILVAILIYIFTANRRKLEQIAYVDDITGGNTIQRFYELMQECLDSSENMKYVLVYTNIENFKILNSQLGRKNCDAILKHFDKYASTTLSEHECMGRLFADNFCILMLYEDEEQLLKRFSQWAEGAETYIKELQVSWGMPLTEFGVFVIDNNSLPVSEMIDRAKLALRESPQQISNKLRYAFYDDKARRKLFREKQLADMMEDALNNQEFKLYLQPKYKLPEEQIGGAEALVRWVSGSDGMIFPDEFIPLFEKNGFIVQVDLWIFEEVCRTLRSWINQGLTPVKVSVNCSRVHFKNMNFLTLYETIAERYDLDKSLLEIELTESTVFENTEQLTGIIRQIRAAGFGCSMDDFGSGYSSLNLIQSIPVDTLKIDKIFFRKNAEEDTRTEAVVGSIIQMSHSLSMVTVAEGVEYRDQVEMLKKAGCDYIQGYVFARPMDVPSFEELAFGDLIGR